MPARPGALQDADPGFRTCDLFPCRRRYTAVGVRDVDGSLGTRGGPAQEEGSPAAPSADTLPYLTLAQAAGMLGVRPDTLRQQALAGKLRTAKLGRMHVTTRSWLDEYRAQHYMQQGRPAETTPEERYAQRYKALREWERSRRPEVATRLAIEAGVYTVLRHPGVLPATLAAIVARHRGAALRRESDAARAQAVSTIVASVYEDALIRDEQYRAQRKLARANRSPLGAQWEKEFWERVAAERSLTAEQQGAIARLDLAVAEALAGRLLANDPAMSPQACRGQLMRAMLEGSANLPEGALACQEVIEATVDKALRQLAHASRGRAQGATA